MKKVFFVLTAVLAGSVFQAQASEYGERGEYYEHGGYGGGRGYYGGGYYEGKFYGTVESMPQGGVLGSWRVNGREVIVTERTFIKEEYGRIGLGAQVEVKGGGNPFMAYEVEVKGGGRGMMGPPPANFPPPLPPPPAMTGTPSNQPLPPPVRSGAALIPHSGPVEAMPVGGLFGTWKIGGKEVIVTDSTIIKQQNGPLAPGANVEVRGGGIPFIAHELEVKAR